MLLDEKSSRTRLTVQVGGIPMEKQRRSIVDLSRKESSLRTFSTVP